MQEGGGSLRPLQVPFALRAVLFGGGRRARLLAEFRILSVADEAERGDARTLDDVQHLGRSIIGRLGVGLELQFRSTDGQGRLRGREKASESGVPFQRISLAGETTTLFFVRSILTSGGVAAGEGRSMSTAWCGHRDGDDEHDEQNEHDVDKRRRVHFHHRFAIITSG